MLLSTLIVNLHLAGCTSEEEQKQSNSIQPIADRESSKSSDDSPLVEESDTKIEQRDPFLNRISPDVFFVSLFDLKKIWSLREADFPHFNLLDSNKEFGIDPRKCDRFAFVSGVYPQWRMVNEDEENPEFEEFAKQISSAVIFEMNGQLDRNAILKPFGSAIQEIKTPQGIVYHVDYQGTMIHFAENDTVIWGEADTVFDLIEIKDESNSLRDRLYELKQQPAFAIYSAAPLQDYLRREQHLDPILPQYQYLQEGLEEVEAGSLILGIEEGADSEFILHGRSSRSMKVLKDALSRQLSRISAWLTRYVREVAIHLESSNSAAAAEKLIGVLQASTIETKDTELSLKLSSEDNYAMIRGFFEGLAEVAQSRAALLQQRANFRDIGVAAHNYYEVHNKFPFEPIRSSDGKPLLSWRVRLLPYLSDSASSNSFSRGPRTIPGFHLDEPWDSEHNLTQLSKIPAPFLDLQNPGGTKTRFFVPRGPGMISDPQQSVAFRDIGDGAAFTLMLLQSDSAHAIEWTRPDESHLNLEAPSAHLEKSGGVCLVQFADTSTYFIDSNTSREDWIALLTIDGGESLDPPYVQPFDLKMTSWKDLRYYASLAETRQNMQRISAHLYDSKTKRVIPRSIQDPDGKPLLSWRVHILPKLGYPDLYEEFRLDESWDSPHNMTLVARIPPIYQRPGGPVDGRTNYLVPVGENSVFEREGISRESIIHSGGGDGFSSVIFLVEVDDAHAVPWTKPEDYRYDPQNPRRSLSGNYPNGFLAAFSGVPSQLVHNDVPDDELRSLFDYRSGKDFSAESLEKYLGLR